MGKFQTFAILLHTKAVSKLISNVFFTINIKNIFFNNTSVNFILCRACLNQNNAFLIKKVGFNMIITDYWCTRNVFIPTLKATKINLL